MVHDTLESAREEASKYANDPNGVIIFQWRDSKKYCVDRFYFVECGRGRKEMLKVCDEIERINVPDDAMFQ